MKLSILDYNQKIAVSFGLDMNDLILIRWFIDYRNTDEMNEVIFDGLAWEGNISTAEKNDTYDAVKTVCNFGTISNNMLNADRVQVYRHFHTFEGVIDIRFAKSNMLAAGRYKGYIYVHAVTEENI